MRVLALIAFAACSSAGDPPKHDELAMLDEAARSAKSADELIALARAYAARGDVAHARGALARVDPAENLGWKLAVLDIRAGLGDDLTEALAEALAKHDNATEIGEVLAAVESKPALAAVAATLARMDAYVEVLDETVATGALVPGTPRWDAVAGAFAGKWWRLTELARHARWIGATAVASSLVHTAGRTGSDLALAIELVLEHDPTLARAVAVRPDDTLEDTPVSHVVDALGRAYFEAALGDVAASNAWLAKVPVLARGSLEDLERREINTDFPRKANCLLRLGALARGERDANFGATSWIDAGCPALLADQGFRDAAQAALDAVGAGLRPAAIVELIRFDIAKGDLARARALALDHNTGLETVAAAYARAGDADGLAKLLALDKSPTAPVTRFVVHMQLAWSLARAGKCDRARPLASELGNATTYAIVARFCPP